MIGVTDPVWLSSLHSSAAPGQPAADLHVMLPIDSNSSVNSRGFLVSYDKVNWGLMEYPLDPTNVSLRLNAVFSLGGRLIFQLGSGLLAYTSDLINWATTSHGIGGNPTSGNFFHLIYFKGFYFALGGSSSPYCRKSADLVSWTTVTVPFTSAYSVLVTSDEHVVVMGNPTVGGIYVTADFATWTSSLSTAGYGMAEFQGKIYVGTFASNYWPSRFNLDGTGYETFTGLPVGCFNPICIDDTLLFHCTNDNKIYRNSGSGWTSGAAGANPAGLSTTTRTFNGVVYAGAYKSTDKGLTWVANDLGEAYGASNCLLGNCTEKTLAVFNCSVVLGVTSPHMLSTLFHWSMNSLACTLTRKGNVTSSYTTSAYNTLGTGKFGGARYPNASGANAINTTWFSLPEFTLEFWCVRSSSYSGQFAYNFINDYDSEGDNNRSSSLSFRDTFTYLAFGSADAGTNSVSTSAYVAPLNVWVHVALVWKQSTQKLSLYVDGVFVLDCTPPSGSFSFSNEFALPYSDHDSGGVFTIDSHPLATIDEITITGKAKYSANFTPPSLPLVTAP